MDIYVEWAMETIKTYLTHDKLPDAGSAPKELIGIRAGCFVSLHTKDTDKLRGCIGTITPTCKNLASEIISNAVSVLSDPRFPKVTIDELDNLDIQVDVLSDLEPINSEKSLNPKKYGVVVKSADGRTGLLLPDLEGIDDADYQIAIARQKAGIGPSENVFLYRFTVTRHKE